MAEMKVMRLDLFTRCRSVSKHFQKDMPHRCRCYLRKMGFHTRIKKVICNKKLD